MHPRGDLAASQSWDGTTKLWDVVTDRPILSTEEGHALDFSNDGRWLRFRHNFHRYGMWPVTVSRVFRTLRNTETPQLTGSIEFSPDGRVLVWSDPTGLWRLDLRDGRYARTRRPDIEQARFSVDGDWLLLAGGAGLQRWRFDRESSAALGGMQLVGEPEGIGTSRHPMNRCMAGGPGGTVWIGVEQWAPPNPFRVLLQPVGGKGRVIESPSKQHIIGLSLSPDGR